MAQAKPAIGTAPGDHVSRILDQWRANHPALDTGGMGVVGRVRRLSAEFLTGMEETWSAFGLNAGGFDVLSTLYRAGPPYSLSPGDLLAQTMVTSGTMTHRIDQLVAAGQAHRVKNPDDGRGFLISLTPEGLRIIRKAATAHAATQKRLIAGLTRNETRQLEALLQKLLVGLETQHPGGK